MPYIGNSPGTGTRNRFIYTATASQTTFSGADDNGKTLKYADSDYVDVYLNGICLVPVTDYTSTSKTSIVLTQAASLNDTLEVVAYDIATISDTVSKADGGTFEGDLGVASASPDLTFTNSTSEDTDGGRESTVTFKGKQSGGEESTLAQIQASHDGTSDDEKGDLIFKTNDGSDGASPTERMRIDSDGQVGIGTSSPDSSGLHIRKDTSATTNNLLQLSNSSGSTTDGVKLVMEVANTSGNGAEIGTVRDGGSFNPYMYFSTSSGVGSAPTERMRIDSSGVVLVGMTSANGVGSTPSDVNGTEIGRGYINLNRDDSAVVRHIQFGTNGAGNAALGTNGGDLFLGTEDTCLIFHNDLDSIIPGGVNAAGRDNAIDMGQASNRFDDIYATNGTIQTSDENEKQQIASLTDAEITAAKAISKLFKTFKWNDSVAENGDNARTHTGVIAQQVETAMSDAGLDAGNYAFFISTTWWEKDVEVAAVEAVEAQDAVYDDDGNLVSEAVEAVEAQEAYTRTDTYYTLEEAPEGATEHNRKGIRYPELLSFIGAATEQRLTSIEARLDALEAG